MSSCHCSGQWKSRSIWFRKGLPIPSWTDNLRFLHQFPRIWQVNVDSVRNRRAPESLGICRLGTRPQSSVNAWDGMMLPRRAAAFEIIVDVDARNEPVCIFESYSTSFWQGRSALARYRLVSRIVSLDLDYRREQVFRNFREASATVADAMIWLNQQTLDDSQSNVSLQT